MAPAAYIAEDWPGWSSMGGEALGPEKAGCPRVKECQDREAGVGGLEGKGRGDWMGRGMEGK